ncbi:hypothetical protein ACT3TZ_14010 [Brachybacterium sp. AOP25-B2-12]|uniref:hypothetical protein n=1 Tax=Brachybacterium sp. AOP25-B2-12 TaxID=3457710 RepID=UPI0040340C31
MSDHEHARAAWDEASHKHVREDAQLLDEARTARLFPIEEELLAPLVPGAAVVHPQSGHGIDDHALIRLGAASVLGLDYSPTAVAAAQRRARELEVPCTYEVAELPRTGIPGGTRISSTRARAPCRGWRTSPPGRERCAGSGRGPVLRVE